MPAASSRYPSRPPIPVGTDRTFADFAKRVLGDEKLGPLVKQRNPQIKKKATIWERAIDPLAQARAKARLRAEQLFDQASDPRADPEAMQELSLGSAALLELSGGAKRDPWQQVLLGFGLVGRNREWFLPSRKQPQAFLIQRT